MKAERLVLVKKPSCVWMSPIRNPFVDSELAMTELIERLANVQHGIWSHWMSHVFRECGQLADDGSFVIVAGHVAQWQRQIKTPYVQLSQQEQESDREQAARVLRVIEGP